MKKTAIPLWTVASIVLLVLLVAGVYHFQVEPARRAEVAAQSLENAKAQLQEKDYEQALMTLQSIPDDAADDWRIPYYKGATLIKLEDFQGAAVELEKAMMLETGKEEIPFALGVAYYKLGNLGLSKSYFAATLAINPDNAEAKGLMDIMANLEQYQVEVQQQGEPVTGQQPGDDATPRDSTVAEHGEQTEPDSSPH